MSRPVDGLTLEDLAPVDHFHARGFPATVELADRLPIEAGQRILDIGCGLGGPARYIAKRFQCNVSGLDITQPFVEAANKLTALVRMQSTVQIELGDGQHLPYPDSAFDGAYTQHVTMNVTDRPRFFAEAYRVLKPGAFFALTRSRSTRPKKGLCHHSGYICSWVRPYCRKCATPLATLRKGAPIQYKWFAASHDEDSCRSAAAASSHCECAG